MTTNPLDEIQARADKATEGPWEVSAFDSGHSRFEMNVSVITQPGDSICDMDGLTRSANEFEAADDGYADAVFIARAREDVPKLVAALRAVEAVAERLDMMSGHTYGYWARQIRAAADEAMS